jgi:putative SOS response-associated peptidase YedK
MRGRFSRRYTSRKIHDLYDPRAPRVNLQAHYNIAPTDSVNVVSPAAGGANEPVSMRWGLIQYRWKSR